MRQILAIARRRLRTSIVTAVIVILILVPVIPFTPSCERHPGDDTPVNGPFTEQYRYAVKAHFRWYGVYYWDIGGLILLRALPFLDGSLYLDQQDGIINAQHKAAWALASKRYIGSFVGKPINGEVYEVPAKIEALRDPASGDFDIHSCEFMYMAVSGKPMPRELLE